MDGKKKICVSVGAHQKKKNAGGGGGGGGQKMWFLEEFANVQLSKYYINLRLNFKIFISLFNFKTG